MKNQKECSKDIHDDSFYKALSSLRAKNNGGFINDEGFRHIKNEGDISGFSYAFWLVKKVGGN